ncbi:sulfatase family protein [Cellulophaga omnivescoria]|uniref:sulfatase family protein n=1 Tax=Cellulophaga omnivescoria TaxID=1888890 RepID=UPI0022F00372|nr:arylsulfatase [Cellulophaga omnivescoria]WBU89832.1 arylsulfatase [Cellulophaga omnivescoria]
MIHLLRNKKRYIYVSLAIATSIFISSCKETKKEADNSAKNNTTMETAKPNIVVIYMDDLGYGDISANGATEISTPNIDKLANDGVRFTNGYATSATCTPSRYGLLTGVYPWRNKDAAILPGTAPLIINTEQTTIPKMLKKQGYATGIVGKWHLGLGQGNVNWNERVSPGPNEVGFDYSYIMAATQDRVPTVYIKNGHVDGLDPKDPIEVDYSKNYDNQPTGKNNPELLSMKWHHGHNNSIVNGIPRIGFMKGGEAAKWSDVDMADHFLKEAKSYVTEHKNEPFFLYYALQQPHVPRTPHPRFVGKSGMGPRGDVILEADWIIGEFIKTLEEEKLLENTLIVFTSDNGPVLNDGYFDDAVEKLGKHTPAGGLRGGKYSLFDAGTRVPFITYWKGKIKPAVSNALVCQVDLLSSLAKLTGSNTNTNDSKQLLDAFLGKSNNGRKHLILEASKKTALRSGDWVLIPPYPGKAINTQVNIELGIANEYQLYNLKEDKQQQNNLAKTNAKKLSELVSIYTQLRGETTEEIKELELK